MKESAKIRAAREYLSREPVVNSYQIARLNEEESEIILMEDEEEISGVFIHQEDTITIRGRYDGVKKLLDQQIESGEEFRFHAVDPNSFRAAKKVLEIEDDRPTWLLKREYEKPQKPEIGVSPLRKDDAAVINEYWGLEGSDSTDYIKHRIEKAPAYGVR